MPNLLDARIQLEGGLERLEAWSEDFAAVRADLASSQWQAWLAAHRHVWERLIAHEQELQPALAKVRGITPVTFTCVDPAARGAADICVTRKKDGMYVFILLNRSG